MSDAATGHGTRAVDRAADLVATVVRADEPMTFADLQDASGLAKSTTSRMLTALERSGLLERDAAGSYVAGRLFWLYAARHDPWEELVRLARPAMEAHRRRHRRDRPPQRHPRRPRRAGRPGRLHATSSAPATGPRSTCPRTARRSARSSSPGARSPSPTATLERPTAGDHHRPRRPAPRRPTAPASAAGRSPPTSSRSASPASPYPSSAPAATSSPRSASPGPPHGWRAGSTSSAASLLDHATAALGPAARPGTPPAHRSTRTEEVVA